LILGGDVSYLFPNQVLASLSTDAASS